MAIIWEREIATAESGEAVREEVPFGLQVAPDCRTLEENAGEKTVILEMFEGIVQDKRLSRIAAELNQRGYRTRRGGHWTTAGVFELLPRLIEVGPRVFPTTEWAERRQRLLAAV
ncbi:MAG: recombinase family protein [Acidobacteria bacterium]|nr:recombinase family protein [Acidobacteriota bacterium]